MPIPAAEATPTMRAVRFEKASCDYAVADVPVPSPGRGEALIAVAASGICQSDVGLTSGKLHPSLPVLTPGHEASGVIAGLGPDTPGWHDGDRVVMAAGRACGGCGPCTAGGAVDDCVRLRIMGFDYDGAWAEYAVVPVASLVRVPAHVPLEQAAVLADAVSTPYGAIVDTAAVRPAEALGIWGLGGLGTHAVQLARLVGACPIIALDPLAAARERALDLGADLALDPLDDDVPARIREATDGRGLDVALDLVARSATMAQADASLGDRGRLVLVGMSQEPVDLGPVALFSRRRHSVAGHLGYRKRHLDQLVALVARGRLDVSRSISAVLPLADVHEGVRRLREHDGNPVRVVLTP